MAWFRADAPRWAQISWGTLASMLVACAPPSEPDLMPGLGSGPPVETGDGPADDPDADDDDGEDAGSSGQAAGDDSDGTGGSGESTATGDACPPTEDGCECALDGTCSAGLTCVEGICGPCEGCEEPSDPCARGVADGSYCGAAIDGDPETLYVCTGGLATSTMPCAHGCVACEPPQAHACRADPQESDAEACGVAEDPCASAMYGDGPYCGETIGGTEETLYLCAGGATTATSVCDFGCAQCDPFVPDVCKSFAGQSDAAACD